MTIAKKTRLVASALMLAGLVEAVSSWRWLQMLGDELGRSTGSTTEKLALAGELKAAANIMRTGQRGILLNTLQNDAKGAEATQRDYRKNSENALALVANLRPLLNDGEEQSGIDALESAIRLHMSCFRQVSGLCQEGKLQEAQAAYKQTGAPSGAAMELQASGLMAMERSLMQASAESGRQTLRSANLALLGTSLLALILLIIALLVIRVLQRRLRQFVKELGEGAAQITTSASQIASSSQSVAAGVSAQSSALDEAARTGAEVASMSRSNVANARSATEVMLAMDARIGEGNRTVDEMVASMREITTSGSEISKIIRVIDEIAFQTNILALNAAVEAARAGGAGTGFAVVADEVRNLARRSAQAAQDTTRLIENSIAKSNEGAGTLQKVTLVIQDITENSGQVRSLIEKVHAESREQARGTETIASTVSQIERVMQSNAAASEQSAAASQELATQAAAIRRAASDLQEAVGS
jgi:methyl-accepting chemotaxis protein/methyl-accepting chemotaxis protein-1 (serine sensor receptor)